ncbi:DEAD/DEAH box helicase, partial [bacterium]|nr:DEAD/DEAH box helicase [bacterium]
MKYPFELSPFQKKAIAGIEEGKHILITAHTGSGKTLPAEYAIQKYHKEGKKVIYTAPIKSLSNQKFYNFTKKFPEISFGILTGDIKFNPEADCLIMTTEILRNHLFQKKSLQNLDSEIKKNVLNFEMDIENELGCVIFDEVHYINDKERGKVWEETIMELPQSVLIVMLSATIDRANEFANWVQIVKNREVSLCSTKERVVPLTHYAYYTLRDKLTEKHGSHNKIIDNNMNKLIELKKPQKSFDERNYQEIKKIETFFYKNRVFVNHSYVINNIVKLLNERNLLPAICFIFSRKKTEEYSKLVSISLNDSKTMNIIRRECKQLLVQKLSNWKEYVNLPEFLTLSNLLQKGIAVHHSGIIPVFKEIIEIMFERGYVKLLFATETFAVGVNMPTKTVLFTGLKKYDGNGFRYLLPHEYTQMAGRAGRRGLDTKGTVIHLNNLFDNPEFSEYSRIMCGTPQHLESKLQIGFQLVLTMLSKNEDIKQFVDKSMLQLSIEKETSNYSKEIDILREKIKKCEEQYKYFKSPKEVIDEYISLKRKFAMSNNKKKKQLKKRIQRVENDYHFIQTDTEKIAKTEIVLKELREIEKYK